MTARVALFLAAVLVPITVLGQSNPTTITVNPSSGSGGTQTFTVTASSNAPISLVQVLFNWNLDAAGACYLVYSGTAGAFSLRSDDGSTWTQWYGPGAPNPNPPLSNNQCTIDVTRAIVSPYKTGNTVTLTVPIQFKAPFIGPQSVWGYASDMNGSVVGWLKFPGSWTAYTAPNPSALPTGLSFSSSAPSGTRGSFTFTASDVNGYAYIPWMEILFNTTSANGRVRATSTTIEPADGSS
jgi:hypothetical protein